MRPRRVKTLEALEYDEMLKIKNRARCNPSVKTPCPPRRIDIFRKMRTGIAEPAVPENEKPEKFKPRRCYHPLRRQT